ncbi:MULTISPECIES: hypothetical protein [unclassified Clostridium]|uniref:hypothetical protein n=1 Tax=unclassified Clostridium TaxID=2614128 RepID=UPI0025BAE93D|nr:MULTISPECIES: hypothetical protein [unclassified Clostridium]
MLLDTLNKANAGKSSRENERILQADIFIENLPRKEKELIENYIASLTSLLALEEFFLYQHGFMDGVKLLKFICKL